MSDISLAAKPAAVPFVPVATTPTARSRDVFLPSDSRRQSRFGALRRRLRWPLGIYTTPVAILMVWEILARTGILKPTYAPPPSDILSTTVELWRDGILGPDLSISLQRAGIGLAIGLSVGRQRVLRNVTLGLHGPDADQRALKALTEVNLAGREKAWPKELSGGEAQRVALARALVSEPELVLLDEPFAALDAITRLRMHDLVRALRRKHHASMLLVTHDVDEAIALADRIVVMNSGRIGDAHRVHLSAPEREASVAREELRAALLSDLGLASQH